MEELVDKIKESISPEESEEVIVVELEDSVPRVTAAELRAIDCGHWRQQPFDPDCRFS